MTNVNDKYVLASRVVEFGLSDHKAQIISLLFNCRNQVNTSCVTKNKRVINDKSLSFLQYALSLINWGPMYLSDTINNKFSMFVNTFDLHVNAYLPWVSIKRRSKQNKHYTPWFTDDLKSKRDTYLSYKQLHDCLNPQDSGPFFKKSNLNKLKREYQRSIKKAKIAYNDDLIVNASNKTKQVWQIIKQSIPNKKSEASNSPSYKLTADGFNKYFIDSVNTMINNIDISDKSYLDYLNNAPKVNTKFKLNHVTVEEVNKVLITLKNSKSNDAFGVNFNILKNIASSISEPLTHLINECFDQGIFPNSLKISRVIPLYKKGCKDNYSNYRPISLIPCFAKVIEICVKNRLVDYFETNNLFYKHQYGYRKGFSTTQAVTRFINVCMENYDFQHKVLAYFFDFSKAFDGVQIEILREKLFHYGLDENSINFIISYLQGWQQYVDLVGTCSGLLELEHGVRQGSVLGPILFLIYINDLPYVMQHLVAAAFLFADDYGIILSSKSVVDLEELQALVLWFLTDWCNANKVKLNSDKTVRLMFNFKSKTINSFKFLGIYIDNKLSWDPHIDYLANKLSTSLYMLRKSSCSLSLNSIKIVYYAHFFSLLSYGIIIWGNAPSVDRLFILQKRALRIMLKLSPRESCKEYFKSNEILTLYALYCYQLLVFIHQARSSLTSVENIHCHYTRQTSQYVVDRFRLTKTAKYNSIQSGVRLYNLLPDYIRALDEKKFTKYIKQLMLNYPLYSISEFKNIKFT